MDPSSFIPDPLNSVTTDFGPPGISSFDPSPTSPEISNNRKALNIFTQLDDQTLIKGLKRTATTAAPDGPTVDQLEIENAELAEKIS